MIDEVDEQPCDQQNAAIPRRLDPELERPSTAIFLQAGASIDDPGSYKRDTYRVQEAHIPRKSAI